MNGNGGLTLNFEVELIQDGASWLAWVTESQYGISFEFIAEGSNEEEQFAYVERVLGSARLVVTKAKGKS